MSIYGDGWRLAACHGCNHFQAITFCEEVVRVARFGDKLGIDCHGKRWLGLPLRHRVSHGGIGLQHNSLLIDGDVHVHGEQ